MKLAFPVDPNEPLTIPVLSSDTAVRDKSPYRVTLPPGSDVQDLVRSLEREANLGREVPDIVVVRRGPPNRSVSPMSLFWPQPTAKSRLTVKLETRAVADNMSLE